MAFLWLALCLTPACCLLHRDEDPEPPIKNLRMQPETRRLTWDLSGNVSEIGCFINSRLITKAVDKRYCQFRVLPSCQVTNFTVASTGDPPFSAGILYPRPGAPAPGRHSLPRLRPRLLEVLPVQAILDVTGGRAARLPAARQEVHVVHRAAQTLRGRLRLERLSLPNITGMCNKSYSIMEWKMSSHFNHRFTYELEIQKGSDPAYTEKAASSGACWRTPPARVRASLTRGGAPRVERPPGSRLGSFQEEKLRAQTRAEGRPECDLGKDTHFRDWLTSALIPLGALLALGLGVALCRRYSVLQKLFPPIPHLKDPISDNLHSSKLVAWEASRASREDCQVAEVQVLGET
ncbi:interleukin-3 receptor subunit alpha [Puma concolor]|uniref:Interleukin-3 receptor subunit alpha n=1 Tax=Puma concolor TaxID=9696 RepID=A0A6P6IQE1_PUMCO|nr:interleukin-3 receptor subunit alpha [Puma concolor]